MSNAQRITVGLAALLIGTLLAACSGGSVATVNGQPINQAAFNKRLEGSLMARTVLQQMVQEMLIEQYAKNGNLKHLAQRIGDRGLVVASAIAASMKPTSQNRTTTCGSLQPFISK